jgi:hypothetical protein
MKNVNANRRHNFGSFAADHWMCGNMPKGIAEIVKIRLGVHSPKRSKAELVDIPCALICVWRELKLR